MSFVVKQISPRQAGGPPIERTRTYDKPAILVGRAADADIVLSDLAVALQHAWVRMGSAGRVTIEPIGTAAVTIDGRLLKEPREVALSRAPVAIVGGQRLAFAADESGNVTIIVERLADPAPARDERRVFSLGGSVPGRRPLAWALVAIVLGLFVAWPILAPHPAATTTTVAGNATIAPSGGSATPVSFATMEGGRPTQTAFHPDQTWDAGALSPPHAFLEKDCAACHAKPFVAVRDENCLGCHAGMQKGMGISHVLRDHADAKRLIASHATIPDFAGKLRAALGPKTGLPEWSCVGCHREHLGKVATPVSTDRFCAECHAQMKSRLPDTKLLNVASWDTHPQFRPVILDNGAPTPQFMRVSLDARPQEESGLKFPHALHLSATNGVAQMSRRLGVAAGYGGTLGCANCHTPDSTGVRFEKIDMEKHCAACHSLEFATENGTLRTLRHGKPSQVVADLRDYLKVRGNGAVFTPDRVRVGLAAGERAQILHAVAVRGGGSDAQIRSVFEKGGACYDCHKVIAPAEPGSLRFGIKSVKFTERYMTRGWFDHSDHATSASPCSSCHAAQTSNRSSDLLLPTVQSCQKCHADSTSGRIHAGQVSSPCSSCHSYHGGPGAPATLRSDASAKIARRVPGATIAAAPVDGFPAPDRRISLSMR